MIGNDVIDSRDLIEALGRSDEGSDDQKTLQEICKEGESTFSDWKYGVALVHENYFSQHAQELAEDTGSIDRHNRWPTNCIDWDQAARELQMDYTCIDIEGHCYWGRA